MTTHYTPMIDEYLRLEAEYIQRYGSSVVLLYQNGAFMELYNYYDKLKPIAVDAGLRTRAYNKSTVIYTAGFGIEQLSVYVNKLTAKNYIVVVYQQDKNNVKSGEEIVRVFKGIYSESTNTNLCEGEIDVDHVWIACVYLLYDGAKIINGNVTMMDTTTGTTHIIIATCREYSQIIKILNDYHAKQVIVYTCDCTLDAVYISTQLELCTHTGSSKILHHVRVNTVSKVVNNVNYQDEYLNTIFPPSQVSPIEHLNLEKYPSLVVCYILLLQFLQEFNNIYTKNLQYPVVVNYTSIVQLTDNTSTQLQLVDRNKYCLFNILNNTCTNGGRRLLSDRLLKPSTDSKWIQEQYNSTAACMPVLEQLRMSLRNIADLERLHRKIYISKCNPNDWHTLHTSYTAAVGVLELAESNKIYAFPMLKQFKDFIKFYIDTFEIGNFEGLMIGGTYDKNIFKVGVAPGLDAMYNYISQLNDTLDKYCSTYALSVGCDKPFKREYIATEGWVIICPKKYLPRLTELHPDLEVKDRTSNSKVKNASLKQCTDLLNKYINDCNTICNAKYLEFLNYVSFTFRDLLHNLSDAINNIDVISTNAYNSIKYKLCVPQLHTEHNVAFVKADKLRNLTAQYSNTNLPHIPNDVNLGLEVTGMLLYGINGSGKSTYGRTIAVGVILAQCGLYVPAESFHYSPYKNIMTKMNMSDNIYAQKSTFINEMLELKKFLTSSGPHTLVVADELAKGTELTSELSLVAAAFRTLVDNKTSTIFMTHIYELADLQLISELKNVGVYHVSTTVTSTGVQYDRRIIQGRCDKLYGIEVAKSLGLCSEYIQLAMNVRNDVSIENNSGCLKTSKYNSNIVVSECSVCGSKNDLHVHHIVEQSKFTEKNNIPFDKNAAHNLAVLCERCHNEVHHGKLKINGYIKGTSGKILDYKWLEVEGK